MAATPVTEKSAPLIGWRMLALLYDLWPVAALWMLVSAGFTVGHYLAGHALRENIAPFSALAWLLWLACWLVTGGYAVVSWRRGGQTLGMRPWRLHVTGIDGQPASWRALFTRFGVGTLSLVFGGLGFWWAWFDRDGLTWHERASATRMVRTPRQPSR